MKYLLLTTLILTTSACANMIPDHHYAFLDKGNETVKCRKSPVGGGLIGGLISETLKRDCIDSYQKQGYKLRP